MTGGKRPKAVLRPLFEGLLDLGFVEVAEDEGSFLRPACGHLSTWTAVSWQRQSPSEIGVFGHVGVHHAQAQRILESLEGQPIGYPDAILRECLRFLVPGKVILGHKPDPFLGPPRMERLVGYAQVGGLYVIPRRECPPEFVRQFRDELVTYGLPWVERLSSDDAILEVLQKTQARFNDQWKKDLPALLIHMGRPAAARRVMEDWLAENAKLAHTPYVRRYRAMYERLLSLYGTGGSGKDA